MDDIARRNERIAQVGTQQQLLPIAIIVLSGGSATDGKPEAIPLDPAAVRSRLVVLRVGDGKDAQSMVILGRPAVAQDIPDMQNTRLDILPREFVRQAILIAARDGLDLATRGEVIDDRLPRSIRPRPMRKSRSYRSSAILDPGS